MPLAVQACPAPRVHTPEEVAYSQHPWNINNLPRCKVRTAGPGGHRSTCSSALLWPVLQPYQQGWPWILPG